jgi:two-component system, NarL family, response regulator DegU
MPGRKKHKIAVVDDQRLFREGIISLIEEYEDLKVTIEAENGKELIAALGSSEPDVILLDLEMPVMDGIKTTDYLSKNYPHLKILVLTMHNDDEFILHMIKKGARGFLMKDSNTETFIEAIYSVVDNEYYFSDRISQVMLKGLISNKKKNPSFSTTDLSNRELEIVRMICKEYTSREISEKLSISLRTVEKHRDSIMQKTKTHNAAGIVMYAVKNRLID